MDETKKQPDCSVAQPPAAENNSEPVAGDNSTPPPATRLEENIIEKRDNVHLSQAALDLAGLAQIEEPEPEPQKTKKELPDDSKAPGLSLKMAWLLAGGLVLAGFLMWAFAAFLLRLPYRIEAITGLALGAVWIGVGFKRFRNPTLVGGLAVIWSFFILLSALYGLPLKEIGAHPNWGRTLLFLLPVGLYTLSSLATIWVTCLVVKKNYFKIAAAVVIAWGLIPLLSAYYSISAGSREAYALAWISSPVGFLSFLPWFLSPAAFTLLALPALGGILCLARQLRVSRLPQAYRHLGPLLLAVSLFLNIPLGMVYLENAFNIKSVNLGEQLTELYVPARNEKASQEVEAAVVPKAAAPNANEAKLAEEAQANEARLAEEAQANEARLAEEAQANEARLAEEAQANEARLATEEQAAKAQAEAITAGEASEVKNPVPQAEAVKAPGPDEPVGAQLEEFKNQFNALSNRLAALEAKNLELENEIKTLKNNTPSANEGQIELGAEKVTAPPFRSDVFLPEPLPVQTPDSGPLSRGPAEDLKAVPSAGTEQGYNN